MPRVFADKWHNRGYNGTHTPGIGHAAQELRGLEVARGGIEPPTYRFSGGRSYQLSYLAAFGGAAMGAREPVELYRNVACRPVPSSASS